MIPKNSEWKNDIEAARLVEHIRSIVPQSENERLRYLEVLLKYLDGIISGDELYRFIMHNDYTEEAKVALTELMQAAKGPQQELIIRLKREVARLRQEALDYAEEIRLGKSARAEKEKLSSEIGEMQAKKERLEREIELLEAKRKLLIEENSKLLSASQEVEWTPVSEKDNVLYSCTPNNIRTTVEEMTKAFAAQCGITSELARQEFILRSPGLYTLIDLMEKHRRFLGNSPLSSLQDFAGIYEALPSIMKNISLPHVKPKTVSAKEEKTETSQMAKSDRLYPYIISSMNSHTTPEQRREKIRAIVAQIKRSTMRNSIYENLGKPGIAFNLPITMEGPNILEEQDVKRHVKRKSA